jgi:ribonuclease VapC
MPDAAGSVLDASALLAYLQREPGGETVQAAVAVGGIINSVNYAEVLSRLSDVGEEPATAHRRLQELGSIGGLLEVTPLTEDDAVAIAPPANNDAATRPLPGRLGPAWPPASVSGGPYLPLIGPGQLLT